MARKRTSRSKEPPPRPTEERSAVTVDRFARLYKLVQYLGGGPRTRDGLTRHLDLDVRGFYRDLEFLRGAGIPVTFEEGHYRLEVDLESSLARLPFPDPHLTLGEARQLAKGRSAAHQYLREQIDRAIS